MESLIIVVSAINLWILGIFIHIYNTIISFFIKKPSCILESRSANLPFHYTEGFLLPLAAPGVYSCLKAQKIELRLQLVRALFVSTA